MKSAKALMMAAALPVALSLAMPVLAADTTTTTTTATVSATAPTAARAKRRHRVRRAGVAKKVAVAAPVKKEAKWVYMAKRMRPPKSKKWQGRWNDLGRSGWELVAMSENMYIFKRSADFSLTAEMSNVGWSNDTGSAVKSATEKAAKKEGKKAAKQATDKAASKASSHLPY